MSLQLSYIMRRSDWIKLLVILVVGFVAVSSLYTEYKKTSEEYEQIQRQISVL